MSLFGSARREGITAAVVLFALVLAVHLVAVSLGLWTPRASDTLAQAMGQAAGAVAREELPFWDARGNGAPALQRGAALFYPPWWLLGRGDDRWWLQLLAALHAALAAVTGYRFLRSQRRSRHAAFLGGATYGLSAIVLGLALVPTEQAAAAWAPLVLEFATRCRQTIPRRRYGPWLPVVCALPFTTGGSAIATVATVTAAIGLVREWLDGPRDQRPAVLRTLTGAAAGTLLLTAPVWLHVLQHLLHLRIGDARVWSPVTLLEARANAPLDAAGMLRVPGAFGVAMLILGLLRHQRHADARPWLCALLGGALLPLVVPAMASWPTLPVGALWLATLAAVVLATAALDDFLDLPIRQPGALRWTVAILVLGAPALLLTGEQAAHTGWPFVAGALLIAGLLTTWRRLGILRFKGALAVGTMTSLVLAALHTFAIAADLRAPGGLGLQLRTFAEVGDPDPDDDTPPPLPAGEVRATSGRLPRIVFEWLPLGATAETRNGGDGPAPVVEGPPGGASPRRDPRASVHALRSDAMHRAFAVSMHTGQGLLCLPCTAAPGWHTEIDGKPVPHVLVDGTLVGVMVPPGDHVVTHTYRPWAAWPGLVLVLLGVAAVAAGALRSLLRR